MEGVTGVQLSSIRGKIVHFESLGWDIEKGVIVHGSKVYLSLVFKSPNKSKKESSYQKSKEILLLLMILSNKQKKVLL
jgi:hypothetical protein